MRAVVQRVSRASVLSEGKLSGEIGKGFLVLLGVSQNDTEAQAELLARKISGLRIFEDENEKMNLSLESVSGDILAVSNFTLYGDASHGFRPSFTEAMEPVRANELYELFCKLCEEKLGKPIQKGVFRTNMQVSLENDGPVTLILDTDEMVKKK